MTGVTIERSDVQAFLPGASDDTVDALIAGTVARAGLLAPCLKSGDGLDADGLAAAKDILVAVVVRALESGTGEITSVAAGPFTQQTDTTRRRAQRFRPDEIRELQAICGNARGGAFTITLGYDRDDALREEVQ